MLEKNEDIAVLFKKAKAGDSEAERKLFLIIWDSLKVIARNWKRRRGGHETLNTTALVNEAALKVPFQKAEDLRRLYALFSQAMDWILTNDYNKKHKTQKREGEKLPFEDTILVQEDNREHIERLNEALELLANLDERQATIIYLKYFKGFKVIEISESLGISTSTVERELRQARGRLGEYYRSGQMK